jgi:membrane-associated phospholipid phosphatase
MLRPWKVRVASVSDSGKEAVSPQSPDLVRRPLRALLAAVGRLLQRLAPPVCVGLLVVGLLQPRLIDTRCVDEPAICAPEGLSWWDRWSIERHEVWAARMDESLQWTVTGTALGIPLLMRSIPGAGLAGVAADWLLLAETAAWNWTLTETAQLLVQRPRPPLFNREINTKPLDRRSQYTSFWSGHTSYVASMGTAFVCLARRQGRRQVQRALLLFALSATAATGAFRILEGRHFLADVLVGALAGALVAWVVFRWRRGNCDARASVTTAATRTDPE